MQASVAINVAVTALLVTIYAAYIVNSLVS
jgi:hypothetical protein